MILAHLIVGAMPVENHHFSWFWFVGNIIPDIDHLFVQVHHRIFSIRRLIKTERFEDRYHLRYKTKYVHSIFGAVVMTTVVLFVNKHAAAYFFAGYIMALLLDWPDIDEKQYLFPFKKKFRGFLPLFPEPNRFLPPVW